MVTSSPCWSTMQLYRPVGSSHRLWRLNLRGLGVLLVLAPWFAGCEGKKEIPQLEEPRPPVESRSSVDRAVATTGDVITYRFTVDYDEDYEIEITEPGAEIAGFRIIDLGREEIRRRQGRVIEERWYRLRADLVGSYVLPPVTVGFRPKSQEVEGQKGEAPSEAGPPFETVETSAIFVEVESVLPAEGGTSDIRGLKPLHRIRQPLPWSWIGGGLATLLLAGGLWVLHHRRGQAEAPPVPPHQLAFRSLAALRQTDFEDPAAVRRFHFAISEVVRAYVEGRFALNATDLTTQEIFSGLDRLPELEKQDGETLNRFLLDTDRVKFADHSPSRREIGQTYESALSFVEATKPLETSEKEAA